MNKYLRGRECPVPGHQSRVHIGQEHKERGGFFSHQLVTTRWEGVQLQQTNYACETLCPIGLVVLGFFLGLMSLSDISDTCISNISNISQLVSRKYPISEFVATRPGIEPMANYDLLPLHQCCSYTLLVIKLNELLKKNTLIFAWSFIHENTDL